VVLKGEDRPADTAERLLFGQMAYHMKLYTASARLYAEAFNDPLGRANADGRAPLDPAAIARGRATRQHSAIPFSAARCQVEPKP
jgi:hypothetical protein